MNILPGNMRFGAGQPVRRLEDQRLVTGKGQFIDDRPEDGALWLHVLRSPHAHAKIVSIDIKAAADMPDVKAVYTGADLVADDIGTIPTLSVFMRPDGSPMTVPPRRLLAHEIVRFAGEPVVATSRRRGWRRRPRRRRSRLNTKCCPRWSIPWRHLSLGRNPAPGATRRPLPRGEVKVSRAMRENTHTQHRSPDEAKRNPGLTVNVAPDFATLIRATFLPTTPAPSWRRCRAGSPTSRRRWCRRGR